MGDSNDYPVFKIQEWKSWGSRSGGLTVLTRLATDPKLTAL